MDSVPLQFPLGGKSDNLAFSNQAGGTTREGINVRGLDPVTGRARGAQRSGMTRHVAGFANAEGTKVQALTSLGFAADLVVHAAATDLDFLTPGSPAADALVWEAVSKTKLDALDCDTDRQGNLYVLVDGGLIEKFNSAGTLISSITIPAVSSEVLVRRIEVSDINIVYTVTRNEATGKGTAYAFNEVERVGEKFFDVLWTLELDLVPYDFSVRGTLMYVLSEVEEDDNAPVYSVVQLITGISDPQAYPLQQFAVPSRPSSLAVGPQGAVFVTCPSQVRRTATPAGFTARTESWSPHDIATSPSTRIYGWWDAASLLDAVDGKKVKEIPYRRTFAADEGVTGTTEIADTTKRPLISVEGLGRQPNRNAPRYDATAFGTMPGIKFNQEAAPPELNTIKVTTGQIGDDGVEITRTVETPFDYGVSGITYTSASLTTGQGLVSRANRDPAFKAVVSDPLPRSRAIFPGWADTTANPLVFMVGMVLRVTRGSGPSIVMQHKGDDFNFGILANVAETVTDLTADTITPTDGSLLFVYGNDAITLATSSAFQEDALYSTIRWGAAPDNTTDAVVVVFIHDSTRAYLRVNGELYHEWTTTGTKAGTGATAFTSLGGTVKGYPSTLDLFQGLGFKSFDGSIAEIVTILGATMTEPHDTDFGHPTGIAAVDAGPGAGQTSFSYHLTGGATKEWEELEGYLAHRWGLSHLLPNALGGNHSGATYDNDHIYGGEGAAIAGSYGIALDANLIALRNPGPILAKYGANYGDLKWALAENGVGHGVTTDPDGNVLTIGEYINDAVAFPGYTQPITVGATPQNIVARKILDLGNTYAINTRRPGLLTFSGATSTTVPLDTETFVVNLAGTSTTFTFVDGVPGAREIDLRVVGVANKSTIAARTLIALEAEYNGVQGIWPDNIFAYNDNDATDPVITISVNLSAYLEIDTFALTETVAAAGSLTVTDFAGGTRVPGSWEFWDTEILSPKNTDARILSDDAGSLYYPLSSTDRSCQVRKLEGTSLDGTTDSLWDICFAEPAAPTGNYRFAANGIALSPNPPIYNPATVTGPEFVYVATDTGRTYTGTPPEAALQGTNVVHKVRVINVTRDGTQLSPRRSVGIVVSGGDLKTFTPAGGYFVPTGGTGAFASLTNHFTHTTLNGLAFFSDSIDTKLYDPKTVAVRNFTATDDGEVPPRILYLATWRGRMVAVSADDPFNWHMSERGNAFGWNEYLNVPTSEQAVSGNNPAALGKSPDVITAVIPYNDEMLLFGCDHTIQRMVGDPMAVALGGFGQRIFGLVSDQTGIAPGASWTKDPEGMLYFFGTTGGVFIMPPGGQPRRISLQKIERALQDVNLNTYRVELVWNIREEGLHVLLQPVGAGGTLVSSFFWERKTDAWWEDQFSSTTLQPTAAFVLDGDDPEDRRLLFGCEDGAIRRWDETSVSDDTLRIASSVLLGPYAAEEEVRFSHLKITLADDQHGARAEVYCSPTPDVMGPVRFTVDLVPGQNPYNFRKAAGCYYWVRVYNANVSERWAYESGMVSTQRIGRKRVRR